MRSDYDCIFTVFPAETLFHVYEKYGARLLEANVRSFLSTTGKVNKGIRETLKEAPENFMAYNNGIVVIADEVRRDRGSGLTIKHSREFWVIKKATRHIFAHKEYLPAMLHPASNLTSSHIICTH